MKLFSFPFSYLNFSLFMQHSKNHEDVNTRKPWYERAMGMRSLWKIISISKSPQHHHVTRSSSSSSSSSKKQQLRKSTSLKVATRVCLCAPISSYNEVFKAEVPPRRSNSFPRVKPSQDRFINPIPSARLSTEGRRVFRGKSLTDDVLMRRFVIEEEAMMHIKRRNQMEVIRSRTMQRRRNKLGPSPLSRMLMAHHHQQ